MSPDVLSRIFAPFTQADASITRKFGGTGLGLTICRKLALLMGGRIRAESEEGKSSRFTLELPFELPVHTVTSVPAEKVLAKTSGSEKSLAILVVEDNPLNQRAAVKLLRKLGYRVQHADNGRQALDVWQQGGIDLILMDIQMPEMDGFEALQIIRAKESATGKRRRSSLLPPKPWTTPVRKYYKPVLTSIWPNRLTWNSYRNLSKKAARNRNYSAPSTFSRCGTICFLRDMTPFSSYRCGSYWG